MVELHTEKRNAACDDAMWGSLPWKPTTPAARAAQRYNGEQPALALTSCFHRRVRPGVSPGRFFDWAMEAFHRNFYLRATFLGVAMAVCGATGQSQEAVAAPTDTQRPQFDLLPFNEDWGTLQNPTLRVDWLDPIKYIPLGAPKEYLSVGGEFRGVYERLQSDNWNPLPYELNSFGLERYMLHLDAHLNPHLRLFIQLESGFEQGRPGGPRPIDAKKLDFLNAFLDVHVTPRESAPVLRVGKQELQFGAGRLISVREGPNLRQGFFGFRVDQQIQKWHTTGFAVRPAADAFGFFDDGPMGSEGLWGFVAQRDWSHIQHYEFNPYYFGLDHKSATFQQGTAHEVRQTIGARFVSDPPKHIEERRLLTHLDLEATYQFGSFGQNPIRARELSTEAGLEFPRLPMFPRLGVHADAATGDRDPSKGVLQTFNALFPNGNYFGIYADTGPGPSNSRDLRIDLLFSPAKSVTVTFDDLLWWRDSLRDGVYNIPGTLIVPAGMSQTRFVGNRPGIELYWQADRHIYVQSDFGVFLKGPFLRQSGKLNNLSLASIWVGYKF